MGPFEYLSVLISIVLGLGITHLLSGFGRWLELRSRFRPFAPALAWAAFLLLVHFQTWWTMFGYAGYGKWDFLQFSMVLLQPIVLFLLATMVFPSGDAPTRDLRENFFHQRPWFFGLLCALVLTSLLKEVVREGRLPGGPNLGFHGLFLAIALVGLRLRGEGGHRALAYLALATFTAYIGLLFFRL